MNTKEIPLFTVTPSAHQALVIGHRKCVTREYALARGVLHAGAYGLNYGSLASAAGGGRTARAGTAGGGRPVAGVWPQVAAGRRVKLFYGHPRSAE
jgi:hypothetical protein